MYFSLLTIEQSLGYLENMHKLKTNRHSSREVVHINGDFTQLRVHYYLGGFLKKISPIVMAWG